MLYKEFRPTKKSEQVNEFCPSFRTDTFLARVLGEGPQGRSEIYTIRPHTPKSNIQPSSFELKVLNKVHHCIIHKGFKWQFFKLLIFSCCSLVESLKMGGGCHHKAHFNMNLAQSFQPRNERSVTPVVEHRHLFKLHLKAWLIPNRPIATLLARRGQSIIKQYGTTHWDWWKHRESA